MLRFKQILKDLTFVKVLRLCGLMASISLLVIFLYLGNMAANSSSIVIPCYVVLAKRLEEVRTKKLSRDIYVETAS